MLTYQKERFTDIMAELPEILLRHWEETPSDTLDPDWALYLKMDALGVLHIVTVRDAEALAGYFFALVQNHLHDKKLHVAYVDLWYAAPEHRKKGVGVRLLKEGEKMLKNLGVKRVTLSVPSTSNLPFLSGGFGYTIAERSYRKEL